MSGFFLFFVLFCFVFFFCDKDSRNYHETDKLSDRSTGKYAKRKKNPEKIGEKRIEEKLKETKKKRNETENNDMSILFSLRFNSNQFIGLRFVSFSFLFN